MDESINGEVTLLLRQFRTRDGATAARLLELIYPVLKRRARSQIGRERPGHLLQPTALVNEAYLRLVAHEEHNWVNRHHFYAAAATAMRRILIDHARAQNSQKREGEQIVISLDEADALTEQPSVDLLDLDIALSELEKVSPRQAKVVELRYFGGCNIPEIARMLHMNTRSVDRDWAAARAWLRQRLKG